MSSIKTNLEKNISQAYERKYSIKVYNWFCLNWMHGKLNIEGNKWHEKFKTCSYWFLLKNVIKVYETLIEKVEFSYEFPLSMKLKSFVELLSFMDRC